jgi:putative transcriptional regulator
VDDVSLKGKLLVATPRLTDPNFFRTVVLLLEHGEEGALGVVLNRPSRTALAEPLPQWEELAAQPAVVFVGGPVAPDAAICLARVTTDPSAGFRPVLDRVGTFDLERDPALAATEVEGLRVFAGYAGWAPGQLEAEIAARGWFVLDALPDDALSPHPAELWSAVLRRQRLPLRMLAAYPLDLSTN